MVRSALSARRGALLALLLAAPLPCGCVQSPLPLPMAPVRARERQEPASAGVVAILDFADRRPDFEKSEEASDERFIGGRYFAQDRFWSFHSADAELPEDPAQAPDLRARVTGTGAFRWYPFPNHGWGKPLPAPLETALPDYLALHLEQRRVFARVVRVSDARVAAAVGATLLLTGHIDRFGAQLAERRDPFVVRPDDWTEWSVQAGADYTVTLTPIEGGAPLLERRCLERADQARLLDDLEHYRGRHAAPYWQLDAEHFPGFAERDLVERARRALEGATVPLIAAIEATVGAPPPAE